MNSIVQAVLEHAKKKPDKIAMATAQKKVTYKELGDKIVSFAMTLKERGIKKGNRIAVEAVDLTSFFAACLGCHLVGAIAVPIERNVSIYKLQDIIKATKPTLIFFKNHGEKYNDFFSKKNVINFRFPKSNTISSIVSTTGTTGKPSLVIHTNRSDVATIENLSKGIDINEDSVMFSNVPFDLSAGYRRVFATLFVGATAIITYKPLSEELLLQFFKEYDVNCISLLNIDIEFLVGTKSEELKEFLKCVNFVETVAGSISSNDINKFRNAFPNVKLYNVYGATESGCLLVNNASENPVDNCIGKPTCNTTLKIIDENGDEVLKAGKYGYLAVKGDMNMTGYYRKKILTESVMRDDYILINDIVYFDEQGYYYFVSRVGDIIYVGGHKIVPNDIEEVCSSFSGVIDCACAARDNKPVIYVECEDDFSFEKFREFLGENLEEYKVPQKIIRVEKIPRTEP